MAFSTSFAIHSESEWAHHLYARVLNASVTNKTNEMCGPEGGQGPYEVMAGALFKIAREHAKYHLLNHGTCQAYQHSKAANKCTFEL